MVTGRLPDYRRFHAVSSVFPTQLKFVEITVGCTVISVIGILIVDDHHQFRARLRTLLESVEQWEVCGEAQNGTEGVEKHCQIRPHVTVMDFNMPDINGLMASREILRKHPEATILLLTVFASSQLAVRAKREGIKGLCSKTQIDCITDAIETLLRGETYFPELFAAQAGD
jgi:DNA-binding NarL/FixJ family response regulator